MAFNWKRLLTWIIGLAFLIALVLFFIQVFGSKPSPTELMLSTITLRSTNDTVHRAELITEMDTTVRELESEPIAAQWSVLTECIAPNTCTQDDYFDFLLMVATERPKDVTHAGLIANAITVNRYWGNSERIIEFSKALSEANDQVAGVDLKSVKNKWQEIIYCDGKCANYHDLFFEFIRLLLAV